MKSIKISVLFVLAMASVHGAPSSAKDVFLNDNQENQNTVSDNSGDNGLESLETKLEALKKHLKVYEKNYEDGSTNGDAKQKILGQGGHGQAAADYPHAVLNGEETTATFGSDGGPCKFDGDCISMPVCINNMCSNGEPDEDEHDSVVTILRLSSITKSGYVAALAVTVPFIASMTLIMMCCWFKGYRGCIRSESGGYECRLRNVNPKHAYIKRTSDENALSQENLLEMAHNVDIDEAAECVLDLAGVNMEDNSLEPVALGSVHMTWSSQSTLASDPDHVDLAVMTGGDTDEDSDDEFTNRQLISRRFSAY